MRLSTANLRFPKKLKGFSSSKGAYELPQIARIRLLTVESKCLALVIISLISTMIEDMILIVKS